MEATGTGNGPDVTADTYRTRFNRNIVFVCLIVVHVNRNNTCGTVYFDVKLVLMRGTAFFQFQNLSKVGLFFIVNIIEFVFLSLIFFIIPAVFTKV